MKKKLFISAMTLLVISATITSANAQNGFQKGLKNIGEGISQDSKSIMNDLKTSVKKDAENKVTATPKAQMKALKQQKEAQLKPVNDSIAAKKKEIEKINKDDSMTETEKTAKLIVVKRQLKYYEIKKAKIEKVYGDKIDALK